MWIMRGFLALLQDKPKCQLKILVFYLNINLDKWKALPENYYYTIKSIIITKFKLKKWYEEENENKR